MSIVDAHGEQIRVRQPAKRRRQCTPDVNHARKIAYWHGLRKIGVSIPSIARDSNLSVGKIHAYTQPGWVEWARQTLAGGKIGKPGNSHAD